MNHQRVLRYTVTIGPKPSKVPGGTPVLFERTPSRCAPGMENLLDVWFVRVLPEKWPSGPEDPDFQWVIPVATGQPVPPSWVHVLSMVDGYVGGVWHLFRVPDDEVEGGELRGP